MLDNQPEASMSACSIQERVNGTPGSLGSATLNAGSVQGEHIRPHLSPRSKPDPHAVFSGTPHVLHNRKKRLPYAAPTAGPCHTLKTPGAIIAP